MCYLGLPYTRASLEAVLGILPWIAARWQCTSTFELKVVVILQLLFFLGFQGTISTLPTHPGVSLLQFAFSRTCLICEASWGWGSSTLSSGT